MRTARRIAALALALATAAVAQWNARDLGSFGIATLTDPAVGARLAARFHATGEPVFLEGDPSAGLRQGDLLRFRDRAFLIDADVWQTLQAEGALRVLRLSPVVRTRARASRAAWDSRARMTAGTREGKAYRFGASLLSTLTETFGGLPDGQRLEIAFQGGDLVLTAPAAFLDRLRALPPPGRADAEPERREAATPLLVSPLPQDTLFAEVEWGWQAWAVDSSGGPSAGLRYELAGALPPGLAWDPGSHRLAGRPHEAGSWPLELSVRAPSGREIRVPFALVVRADQPPRLETDPPAMIVGRPWIWALAPRDPDHPASSLRLSTGPLPEGMFFDTAGSRLAWLPPDSVAGRPIPVAVRVTDPLGGWTERLDTLRPRQEDLALASLGLQLSLPWDTLIEQRTYRWDPAATLAPWRGRARLVSAEADGQATWNDTELVVRPEHAGELVLRLLFSLDGTPQEIASHHVVRPDQAPIWRSATSGTALPANGARSLYRPIALDPEGDSVHIEQVFRSDPTVGWDGRAAWVDPGPPGLVTAVFAARDAHGRESRQAVAWTRASDATGGWTLETRSEAGTAPWILSRDFGTGRIGLFVPDLPRLVGWRTWADQQWPYLFAGANLLGPRAAAAGSRLFFDLGVTVRAPNARVVSGGGMGRVQGTWRFAGRVPWQAEAEILGWIDQGILLVDTAGLTLTTGGEDLGAVLDIQDQYQSTFQNVLDDAFRRRNAVFVSRLEAWFPLGAGFWAGPGLWREDLPVAALYRQRIGGGLRGSWRLGSTRLEPSGRVGWGPADAGWSAWASLSISSIEP